MENCVFIEKTGGENRSVFAFTVVIPEKAEQYVGMFTKRFDELKEFVEKSYNGKAGMVELPFELLYYKKDGEVSEFTVQLYYELKKKKREDETDVFVGIGNVILNMKMKGMFDGGDEELFMEERLGRLKEYLKAHGIAVEYNVRKPETLEDYRMMSPMEAIEEG